MTVNAGILPILLAHYFFVCQYGGKLVHCFTSILVPFFPVYNYYQLFVGPEVWLLYYCISTLCVCIKDSYDCLPDSLREVICFCIGIKISMLCNVHVF